MIKTDGLFVLLMIKTYAPFTLLVSLSSLQISFNQPVIFPVTVFFLIYVVCLFYFCLNLVRVCFCVGCLNLVGCGYCKCEIDYCILLWWWWCLNFVGCIAFVLVYIAFVLLVLEFRGLYWFCIGVYCLNLVGYGYHKCEIGVCSENHFCSSANENPKDEWTEPNLKTEPKYFDSVRFWNSVYIRFEVLRNFYIQIGSNWNWIESN